MKKLIIVAAIFMLGGCINTRLGMGMFAVESSDYGRGSGYSLDFSGANNLCITYSRLYYETELTDKLMINTFIVYPSNLIVELGWGGHQNGDDSWGTGPSVGWGICSYPKPANFSSYTESFRDKLDTEGALFGWSLIGSCYGWLGSEDDGYEMQVAAKVHVLF